MPPSRTSSARPGRLRLDQLLVERGLAASRAEAARLVLAGRVRLGEGPGDKPGRLVRADAALALVRASPFVGRGGEKLQAALEAFGVAATDLVCLDVGASTGGFTDCLLQRGARRVHAVDVGRGQLHPRVRGDPRVRVHEGVNARYLAPETLGEPVALAVIDVAFISLDKVLPAVAGCLTPDATVVALVKPQFEVGPRQVGKGGVVRDAARHREVLLRVAAAARALGLRPDGVLPSPLRGARGNREFLVRLRPGATGPGDPEAFAAAVERAVEAGP
jgi:23S rRNA (cytidine1920-2'-O)/16S rRNA (cytidine1409-2'-O)-methyltransferase